MARGRGRGRVGAGHAPAGGGGRGRGRGHGGGGGNSVGKFLAPHTGRQAGAVANAEAGTEYNAPIREAREQAKGSRKRQGDLGQWYAQLASDYRGAQAAGASALKSVEDTTSSQLAAAGGRSDAEQAQLAGQDEQFASLVGGPKDTAGLAKIAQAAQAAGAARVDQSKPVLSEQANFVARLGGDKAAARMKGIEARQEERDRRDKIIKELGAVRKEKGQARVANKEKIRESDRGYAAELKKLKLARREARTAEQAAAASAALAQVESARKAEQDAISNRQEQQRIGISAKNAATARRSQRATAKHYTKENSGGLSTAEKRSRGEHSADAMSTAKALLGIKVPKSGKEWSQFEAALIEKLGSSYGAEAASAVAKLRKAQKEKAAAKAAQNKYRNLVPGF
jgi:hypothetical protein